jgi:hypothetical protein
MRENESEDVPQCLGRAEDRANKAKRPSGTSGPTASETRQLAAHSRARVRDERANLRRLTNGLVATDAVIERAIAAFALSMSLLRNH